MEPLLDNILLPVDQPFGPTISSSSREERLFVVMKGLTVTSAAAAVCCLAATSVSASLPTAGTFGIVKNHAFAGLNARGGAVGKLY